jgi:superfamily I DNA and/or RNA helicase
LLDPKIFHFDVVIFDEASQLTTEDCIGSIIRGTKLVVAGDTKQLPPTSFFKTVVEPEEEDFDEEQIQEPEREDLDSILDECTTSGFPQCMLKWHYRSKHEHLIAFSNKHLYQELYTFPNCIETSDTLGVKFIYHTPTQATKEEMCLEEARIVAKAVMQHAKQHPNMTLGVATLNIKQKSLIENEIEKLREKDSSCEEFFNNNGQEYFFVKNLESVQGDERDVIMISAGYFKNKNGILSMNFGPINQDGGERRLNVLITRARYMIQVFSGIKASDFNLEKTSSMGVKLLQAYLDFAEKGESSFTKKEEIFKNNTFVSPFEESVYKALLEKGYSVTSQVGCSDYKIDLAVRDKNNPNKFLVGIECDGQTYNSCATVRDRDRLRQEVLERLGWKMYRVWSADWFKNPTEQLEKLTKFIDNICNKNN